MGALARPVSSGPAWHLPSRAEPGLVGETILGNLTAGRPHPFLGGEPSIEKALVVLFDQVGDDGLHGLLHSPLLSRKAPYQH